MKKYKLYDIYEGYYLIGKYDSLSEVQKAARQWDVEETDGECFLLLKELRDDGKYYDIDFSY